MELHEQVIVVGGAAGEVGAGITYGLAQAGATVVAVSRGEARLEVLTRYLGGLMDGGRVHLVVGDLGTEAGAGDVLQSTIERFGRVDGAVASLGGYAYGETMLEVSIDRVQQVLGDNLLSHVAMAKAFIPALTTGGTYVLIGGKGAEAPLAKAGPVNIAGAAQRMLAETLAIEATDVRVIQALPETPVMSRGRKAGRRDWISDREFGDGVAALFAGDDKQVVSKAHVRQDGVFLYFDKPQLDPKG